MIGLSMGLALLSAWPSSAQEARRRWEKMCQIRQEKFDYVLPEAMRENGIAMWITVIREGDYGPLYEDLGRGYPAEKAFYIFTDRGGERIERVALGLDGYLLEECRSTTSWRGKQTFAPSSRSGIRNVSA
jgi:hypothetical protein